MQLIHNGCQFTLNGPILEISKGDRALMKLPLIMREER